MTRSDQIWKRRNKNVYMISNEEKFYIIGLMKTFSTPPYSEYVQKAAEPGCACSVLCMHDNYNFMIDVMMDG